MTLQPSGSLIAIDVLRGKADLPPRIIEAVKAVWEAKFGTKAQAFDSGRFRMLCHICSSVYPEIPGTRLPKATAGDIARRELHEAICNFFRWIGAPWYRENLWYRENPCITAEDAATQLHA